MYAPGDQSENLRLTFGGSPQDSESDASRTKQRPGLDGAGSFVYVRDSAKVI